MTNKKNKLTIDFVGYPKANIGVGQQLRSICECALLAGYKINIIDLSEPNNIYYDNSNKQFSTYISNKFKGDVRIFSGTIDNICSHIFSKGLDFINNKYNIFHLAWEFNTIDKKLLPALNFADQVWTISNFVRDAFKKHHKLVRVLNNSLNLDTKPSNSKFNLPEGFNFLYIFDCNSFIERKNPMALLHAFKQINDANLILKINNIDTHIQRNLIHELLEVSLSMSNVHIITDSLKREDLLSLISTCDAYISPHRSEGFGLTIIEAMALNKPVIVTNYSGNKDFCNNKNSFLLKHKLIRVKKNDYHYSNSQSFWADVSIESIVDQVNVLMNDHCKRTNIINNAYLTTKDYSNTAIASKFDSYIKELVSE